MAVVFEVWSNPRGCCHRAGINHRRPRLLWWLGSQSISGPSRARLPRKLPIAFCFRSHQLMNQDQARLFGFDPRFQNPFAWGIGFPAGKGEQGPGEVAWGQLRAGGEVCVPPRAGRRRQSWGEGRMQTRSQDQLAETYPWGITRRSEPVRLPEPGRGERDEAGARGKGRGEEWAESGQGGEGGRQERGEQRGAPSPGHDGCRDGLVGARRRGEKWDGGGGKRLGAPGAPPEPTWPRAGVGAQPGREHGVPQTIKCEGQRRASSFAAR